MNKALACSRKVLGRDLLIRTHQQTTSQTSQHASPRSLHPEKPPALLPAEHQLQLLLN